jgi:hypothetical protein
MRLPIQLALVASLSVFSFACGSPTAGEQCSQTGFLCESAASALECRVGTWASLPCKGPNGCKREGDLVKCDMTGNSEGDNCASSAEGKGLCTSDNAGVLQCRDGKLVKTNTCRSCSVSGDVVTCQP